MILDVFKFYDNLFLAKYQKNKKNIIPIVLFLRYTKLQYL